MLAGEQLATEQSLASACAALGVPRSSVYRRRKPDSPEPKPQRSRSAPPRALGQAEKDKLRDLLDSERFQDLAPREVYASLLDEGVYYCSWRTLYRVLASCDQVRERRNQLRHPAYAKPELMATGPNQVWSWDITKLRGPSKGLYYHLYVILDIFSRYVVGWMIAEVESAELADQLIAETCAKQGLQRGQLTIHADNSSPMTAKDEGVDV
jgi:putative transposase